MDNELLTLDNLYKTFQKGSINENLVLDGISFSVNKGDFISIIGGNGSGKSTLLNTIAGTTNVDSGTIKLDNVDITSYNEEKRAQFISRVHQDPMIGTAPRMTVAENLSIALRRGERRGFSKTLNKKNIDSFKELLKSVDLGLENKTNIEIGLLSGGQRQIISLLMATIKIPNLLLLDEHTAALDPKTSAQVMNITSNRIRENNITSLMITHNLQHAIDYGNRLIMMDKGRVVLNVSEEEKHRLTVQNLMELFHQRAEAPNLER